MNIKNFKYDEVGLNRFFGPLEANIMEYLWDKDEQSIKAVQQSLEVDKPINFNTVMTVMNRLVEKAFLKRGLKEGFHYFARCSPKRSFFEEQSKKLTENLLDEFGGAVISHMLDAMKDADQGLIEKLEQKNSIVKKDKL
ncbi:BlaI/MecI/CopY family transcriptional regulator [[Brevibacterium] frigoritolerans]|uniref:BlaI/MecI/CopY family transcriptional regulator n=1 Tax=Peribacillus frigoritolerans TaxID=450367 RepID=A0A941J210_9BACI|nr:BlaI/MecI/CopY family transcriptional regulator [Peribacillus frigoritolerans]